jgi:predicted ATPase/DNA-binding SARP family transcriptional activator
VLGPLEVIGADGPIPIRGTRRLALLAVLLLERGRVLSRDRLIEELWGDAPPPTAVNALQVHVAVLRRLLGGRIHTAGSGYGLDVADEQVDASRFERQLALARQVVDHARRAALLGEALALWRGPAFAGVPRTPAVEATSSRLEEMRLGAVEDRIEADMAGGRHETLVPELRELVTSHPERERLAGHLMLALHRAGRSADALQAYRDLSQRLDTSLGVDPSDGLIELEKAIRRADPSLAAPLPGALPVPPSRFIGRQRELDDTARLLGSTRLLTLVGPGGCGKTRLAIELAARVLIGHPDGAHFVDLAPLSSEVAIAHAAAVALHVRRRPGEPLNVALTAHIGQRRLLVILDNCEHVAAAAAAFAGMLLEACTGLRVLATSRQPLGIAGETVWRVPSLELPVAGSDSATAARSDAVRLLADRASSVLPGHVLGADDAGLAAAVCRRVDALPLAIELVAGRLPSLTLTEVATHLDRRLALLASAGSGPRRRHRTMAAAIDWSYELLSPEERALFRRLGPFVGGFTLEWAEALGSDPAGESPRSPGEVLPLLLRLADKSMVVAERAEPQLTWYRLLETIREYALARLEEAGEGARVRGRHAALCQRLAESTPAYSGLEATALDHELGNVRAALDWCLGAGRAPEQGLAIAAPLWWHWWARGASDEGLDWLLRCLAAVDPAPTAARGLGLRAAAALARACGDNDRALRLGEECVLTYRGLGDTLGLAAALNGLCITAAHMGDNETALRYGTASLEQARAAGSRHGEASSLNNIGMLLRYQGRMGEAEAAITQALAGFQETDNRRGEAAALNNLALQAHRRGDMVEARRRARESMEIYNALHLNEGVLDALDTLAAVEVAEGRPHRALFLLTVIDRERDRLGQPNLNAQETRDHLEWLAAAVDALDEPHRSAVLTEAGRTGLEAVVADLLERR